MECPNCKDALVTMELGGIEIDHCFTCRGIWLDSGELSYLLETGNKSDSFLETIRPAQTREKSKPCPICKKKMEKILIGQATLLDRCTHGLWSDEGELESILNEAKGSQAKDKSLLLRTLEDMFSYNK